ncbi:MAG TPA: hypothetical protein DIW24_04500 [Bacteroidetes bacterium]|nr:hypothetical protein [Bacteroidota bacterium]
MKNIALGGFISAIATFMWGFLFWATPISQPAMKHATPEQNTTIREILKQNLSETGTYFIPDQMHDMDGFMHQHREGPLATIHFRREGAEAMGLGVMLQGLFHMMIVWLFVGWVLSQFRQLDTYTKRLRTVLFFGVASAVWSTLGMPIWYFQPWAYWMMTCVYDVGAWAIAAAILARFIKPA